MTDQWSLCLCTSLGKVSTISLILLQWNTVCWSNFPHQTPTVTSRTYQSWALSRSKPWRTPRFSVSFFLFLLWNLLCRRPACSFLFADTVESAIAKELDDQKLRYQPESLDLLIEKTQFSKKELKYLYQCFKQVFEERNEILELPEWLRVQRAIRANHPQLLPDPHARK